MKWNGKADRYRSGLRILQVHNRYQYAGGEDIVVQMEKYLLEQHGHTVSSYEADNADIRTFMDRLAAAVNVTYCRNVRARVLTLIKAYQPDVVHVHNFFPQLSPSVYDACWETGTPVVQTLHNYRTICPGALLTRNGKPCNRCITGSAYQAVRYGCYRQSTLGTLAVAHMVETHRRRRTWHERVSCFIVPSVFAKKKFIEGGFPAEKIVVKPHCTGAPVLQTLPFSHRKGAVFVGRLSREKGILTLLESWKAVGETPLRIIGNGPLLERVHTMSMNHVTLLGWQTPRQVSQELSRAAFLIIPSECSEMFSLSFIEAFAHAMPVVMSRLSSMVEFVIEGNTGRFFEPGNPDDLAETLCWMLAHPRKCEQMGQNARQEYLRKYTPERNYEMLLHIYHKVLKG